MSGGGGIIIEEGGGKKKEGRGKLWREQRERFWTYWLDQLLSKPSGCMV